VSRVAPPHYSPSYPGLPATRPTPAVDRDLQERTGQVSGREQPAGSDGPRLRRCVGGEFAKGSLAVRFVVCYLKFEPVMTFVIFIITFFSFIMMLVIFIMSFVLPKLVRPRPDLLLEA